MISSHNALFLISHNPLWIKYAYIHVALKQMGNTKSTVNSSSVCLLVYVYLLDFFFSFISFVALFALFHIQVTQAEETEKNHH
jgi:hypothetical protein